MEMVLPGFSAPLAVIIRLSAHPYLSSPKKDILIVKILPAIPASSPANSMVSERGHLATFANAYAVAVRLREATEATQFIVSTQDPSQPFRIMPALPSDPCRIVSTIA